MGLINLEHGLLCMCVHQVHLIQWAPVGWIDINRFFIVRPVSRAEVWLVQAPEDLQQCVWDVVVLAAVSAMEGGQWLWPRRGSRLFLLVRLFAGAGHHPRGGRVLWPAAGVCGPRAP